MATRTDQLHSYQFMLQRVIAAQVMRETDPAQAPLRRGVGAVFGGVMIAILLAAGFGVYGIFTGIGSLKWHEDNSIVVEKETGAVYVYRGETLHPMINYASALLAAGTGAKHFRVNAEELRDTPRSGPAGIPNAPTSLPGTENLVGMPWTLCMVPSTDAAGAATTLTTLSVGGQPQGGTDLHGKGLLVADSATSDRYLVWHGHRYLLGDADKTTKALFGARTAPLTVASAWLNGLPSGTAIRPIDVPDRGGQSPVDGHEIGDVVYTKTGSGPQYYLVFGDGLAPITELQKTLLASQYPVDPERIQLTDANAAPNSESLPQSTDEHTRPPDEVPTLASTVSSDTVCAKTTSADKSTPRILVGADVNAVHNGVRTPSRSGSGVALADRVLVPPGRVGVVRSMPASGHGAGTYNIVTDTGRRFPVPSADALQSLGYTPSAATDIPASLVDTVPSGPTLDPAKALAPASG